MTLEQDYIIQQEKDLNDMQQENDTHDLQKQNYKQQQNNMQQNNMQHQQHIYSDNCQQVLNDISSVKALVETIKEMDNLYYPNNLNVFQLNELSDSRQHKECIQHLDRLRTRISDTSSKVLVTGDLNSGKSTLVNALLKRDILPVDQQPCTSIFCEVVSSSENEELTTIVHAIDNVSDYDKNNHLTYHTLEARHLYQLLTAEEQEYKMLKIYASRNQALTENCLLFNGLVDIVLIDSPGLNTDSVKTTAVFAREEEIDVIVFVVGAENHFTLSGKEFLWNAANEKTHIFIVVNRFDNIRDKDRCKRLILEQIKQLSPFTFEHANDLIHFVSAENEADSFDFIQLEQKLRLFVLNNRIQSKLLPANNYLTNVLRDIYFIATTNESTETDHLNQVSTLESNFLSTYSTLIQTKDDVENKIESLKNSTMTTIQTFISNQYQEMMSDKELDQCIQSIQYPGLLYTWKYAHDIVRSLLFNLESNLNKIQNQINQDTIDTIEEMNNVNHDLTTTKTQPNLIPTKSNDPIQITIETKDLLFTRMIQDDKKVTVSALTTLSTTSILLFKSMLFRSSPSRLITCTLTVAGMLGLGWTAYSYISVIPKALETNLKQKFKFAVQQENLVINQTHHITQSVEHALESKQTEISFLMNQIITEKELEKSKLQQSVFHSKTALNQFRNLVIQSNALLVKVQEPLCVVSII